MTWAIDAIGTDQENCWTFVRAVYAEQLEIDLPRFASTMVGNLADIVRTMKVETTSPGWVKVEEPKEFTVVAMSKSDHIHHVGVWTEQDGGKVLHAFNEDPVVANTPLQLRRMGFKRVEFYELSETSSS